MLTLRLPFFTSVFFFLSRRRNKWGRGRGGEGTHLWSDQSRTPQRNCCQSLQEIRVALPDLKRLQLLLIRFSLGRRSSGSLVMPDIMTVLCISHSLIGYLLSLQSSEPVTKGQNGTMHSKFELRNFSKMLLKFLNLIKEQKQKTKTKGVEKITETKLVQWTWRFPSCPMENQLG